MINMKKIENIALIGLGAVGCAYLTTIAEHLSPEKIRVVAAGERAERYRKNGITYNGRQYRFNVAEPGSGERPADLVFVAVKNTQLAAAVEEIGDFVGPETVIIAPLNGVTSEKVLMERYGAERVLYSYAMKIDATREGDCTFCKNTGFIPFGEARNEPGRYSENVTAVEEFFRRTGIEYEIPEDMITSLWKKFMMNTGLNQTSAILGFTYGMMQRSSSACALMRSAMEEAAAVAGAEGISLGTPEIDDCFRIMDMLGAEGKTSMLQDIEARRPTEVGAFAGTVVEIADRHGLAVPVNRTYLRQIRALEEAFLI